MAYAILRFAKRKGGAAKAIAAHNERTKEAYASNPDIDKSRTVQNYHLIVPRWSYGQEIRHRISMASCRVRRDSVKFVETLITTSPEFAKAHEAEMPEYFERALGFLKERVGEENIFSAVVHMDEKTPHLHLCFVPLTKDNRLSAKEILGNKKRMIQWQDDFYACMSERWPELERGAPAVLELDGYARPVPFHAAGQIGEAGQARVVRDAQATGEGVAGGIDGCGLNGDKPGLARSS